jgi:2-iminobutanoate/2-iminopropanoate deaminase
MPKEYINPPDLFSSVPFGFSQAIACHGGKTVYISGQTAWDSEKKIVGGMNLKDQARQALKNLQVAVTSAGGGLKDIVSLRIYVVKDQSSNIGSVGEALREFFPGEKPPTSTWLGISFLAVSDFLIEIEAIAVIESDG